MTSTNCEIALATLSLAEVEEIISVLKTIQLNRGWNFKFYDRQVNLLIEVWSVIADNKWPKISN
jgi:hypothetical protein